MKDIKYRIATNSQIEIEGLVLDRRDDDHFVLTTFIPFAVTVISKQDAKKLIDWLTLQIK